MRAFSDQTKQINLYLSANGVKINWYYLVLFNLCSFIFRAQRRVERKWKMKNERHDTPVHRARAKPIYPKMLQTFISHSHVCRARYGSATVDIRRRYTPTECIRAHDEILLTIIFVSAFMCMCARFVLSSMLSVYTTENPNKNENEKKKVPFFLMLRRIFD